MRIRRRLRASLAALALIAGAVGLSAGPAGATSSIASGVFVACGYSSPVPITVSIGSGCTSLPDAVTAAESYGGAGVHALIEMMPGNYCPIDIPSATDQLTFQGVGVAGVDTSGGPVGVGGFEAALTTFAWNLAGCGDGITPSAMIAANGYLAASPLTFENLTIDGTAGTDIGMNIDGAALNLRDVLIQNEDQTGLAYENGPDEDMHVANSAFLGNGDGVVIQGEGSVDESTLAANVVGLDLDGDIHLDNDTVSHNQLGIDIPDPGNTVQMANTIVGDNANHDCEGVVGPGRDLEPGGAAAGNGNNLFGTTCKSGVSTDIALTHAVADTAANGGPTPTILPPSQAVGAAAPRHCHSTGSDQREFVVKAGAACDIGAVEKGGVGTIKPTTTPTRLTFGSATVSQPKSAAVKVFNAGGDLMGISAVDLTGAGFAIAAGGDGCTLHVIGRQPRSACVVTITAAPAEPTDTGSLSIHTTGGNLTVKLSATDASSLTAPKPRQISYGRMTTLRTTLTDAATHAAIAGTHVTLLSRADGSAKFRSVATVVTDSHGAAKERVAPHANTQYEWSFPGSAGHGSRITTPTTVSVAQSVAAALQPAKDRPGKAVMVYGTVSPNESGRSVTLERLVHGKWTSLKATAKIKLQKLPNHRKLLGYVLSYRPTTSGEEALRVSRSATRTNAAGVSKRLTLTVT